MAFPEMDDGEFICFRKVMCYNGEDAASCLDAFGTFNNDESNAFVR